MLRLERECRRAVFADFQRQRAVAVLADPAVAGFQQSRARHRPDRRRAHRIRSRRSAARCRRCQRHAFIADIGLVVQRVDHRIDQHGAVETHAGIRIGQKVDQLNDRVRTHQSMSLRRSPIASRRGRHRSAPDRPPPRAAAGCAGRLAKTSPAVRRDRSAPPKRCRRRDGIVVQTSETAATMLE
jgi:hypothetical protein